MKKYQISKNYSRRNVLKILGASAAAPFLPVLNAEAASGSAPKRFLIMTTPSGLGNGMIPTSPGPNYQNGPAFKVLDKFKDKINIYRGLDFKALGQNLSDGREFKVPNSHPALAPHLLTAAFTQRPGIPNDPGFNLQDVLFESDDKSIEHYIAQRIEKEVVQTAQPYVFAGVDTPKTIYSQQSYVGPQNSIFPQVDAEVLHSTIFKNVKDNAGGGIDSNTNADAEIAQRIAEKKSVIDYAKEEIDAVRKVISSLDQAKMDAHLNGIREVERQLEIQAATGSISCSIPTLQDKNGPSEDIIFRRNGENMTNIMVQALACDITRVGNLMWGGAAQNTRFHTLDLGFMAHHDLTHGAINGFNSEASKAARDKITEWYANRFLFLLEQMDNIQEGDGSLLDNTLIIWTSEHSNETRQHDRQNIPFISAGSCCGAINTGQFFDYTSNRRGHGDMYVTAAHAMGFTDLDKFGIPDVSEGPLPGVLA